MAKFVSLGNVLEDAKSALKGNVNAMDALIGAVIAKLGGRYVGAYIKRAVALPNADGTPSASPPATTDTLKTLLWNNAEELGQLGIGVGLAVAQKGSERGKSHFVGAAAMAATGVAAKQLAATLPQPASIKAYLAADFVAMGRALGMGVVTRAAYGAIERANYSDDFDDRQQDMLALGRMSEAMDRVPEAPMYD